MLHFTLLHSALECRLSAHGSFDNNSSLMELISEFLQFCSAGSLFEAGCVCELLQLEMICSGSLSKC